MPRITQLNTPRVDSAAGEEDEISVIEVVDDNEGDSSADEEDGELDFEGLGKDTMRWMVSGGKDRRLALWQLKDFSRK